MFIPAGRTSLVKKGNAGLQLQTEYAYRPYPRITTTVSSSGQVLHKIERKLKRAIESFEEQQKVEEAIRRQHSEVSSVIEQQTFVASLGFKDKLEEKWNGLSLFDQIASIPGVEKIFKLDTDGHFYSSENGNEFKKVFSTIFKNLRDLLEVFSQLPGDPMTRERGVYEVQPNRLYFASLGNECLFIIVRRTDDLTNYEQAISKIIKDSEAV